MTNTIPTSRGIPLTPDAEWLEADGLGGFAAGTVSGLRTRRYHALLLTATTPPTGRFVLVNGFDAWVKTAAGRFALSSQAYRPDVVHPDGRQRIASFDTDPWPRWRFRLEDGTCIEHELFVRHAAPVVVLSWRLREPRAEAILTVRPFLSGRDYHALHHENPSFRFDAEVSAEQVRWHPYPDVPAVLAVSNGEYHQQPDWYRNFLYAEERARGLDDTEDLATPGVFRWDLSHSEAVLMLAADSQEARALLLGASATQCAQKLRTAEQRRRRGFPSPLHRAADAYLVRRGTGKTLVAGYPWFTDWGRDTFIALRGLCLATERLADARQILLEWAGTVSEGMLPNRFPDHGEAPEFNSVDAALWYIIAVHDFLQAMQRMQRKVTQRDQQILRSAIDNILSGYIAGTRYGIGLDDDGLLRAGEPGAQLTWMDARVDGREITPRIGKPVEIEALWLNALAIGGSFSPQWQDVYVRGRASFQSRFWNEAGRYLYDVVDVDHQAGAVDTTFRPNQIFSVGGLPLCLLDTEPAHRVVEAVAARLWTPLGLRSLAPEEPEYCGRYTGGARERDGVYHQGTVWPWLSGAFVEAWVRGHGNSPEAKQEARTRFLEPLLRHLNDAGLGHISEIADGEAPHTPRGCPFQAWSLGEVLRLSLVVLAQDEEAAASETLNVTTGVLLGSRSTM